MWWKGFLVLLYLCANTVLLDPDGRQNRVRRGSQFCGTPNRRVPLRVGRRNRRLVTISLARRLSYRTGRQNRRLPLSEVARRRCYPDPFGLIWSGVLIWIAQLGISPSIVTALLTPDATHSRSIHAS